MKHTHFITTKPDVMGGQPCIVGTRIPVSLLLIRLKQGHTIEDIQDMYPFVTLKTFEGAMEELAEYIDQHPHDFTEQTKNGH